MNIAPVEKKGNFLTRTKDKIDSWHKEFKEDMAENILQTLLPKVKALLPIANRQLKAFLGKQDKIIVIKSELSGDVSVTIMKHQKIGIIPKKMVEYAQAYAQQNNIEFTKEDLDFIESIHSVDDCAEMLLKGNLEKMVD